MQEIQKREVQGSILSKKMNFPGIRQSSVAWDAKTAIDIVMDLPGVRARQFRKVACESIMRLLGGDQTLHAEIDQQLERNDDTSRFFQRSVEQHHAEAGPSQPVRDELWHSHRIGKSKPAHNKMAGKFSKGFEIDVSVAVCKAVHNKSPKVYGDDLELEFGEKINKKRRKDFYPLEQQTVSTTALTCITSQVPEGDSEKLERVCGLFADLSRGLGFHNPGTPQLPPPPKRKELEDSTQNPKTKKNKEK